MRTVDLRNREILEKAMKKHAASRKPLREWADKVARAEWHSIVDARRTFSTADYVKGTNRTCFNVGGNSFRLIAVVSYELQIVSIFEFLTHDEYNEKYVRRKS
jgi:mRNA interferase HigB